MRGVERLFWLLIFVTMVSCDSKNDPSGEPEQPDEGTFEVKWDYLVENGISLEHQMFIGTRYLGIEDYNGSLATPPSDALYVGAVFTKTNFGKDFEDEVSGAKNVVSVMASFGQTIAGLNTEFVPSQFNYKGLIKDILASEEWVKFVGTSHSPAVYGICNLRSMSNLGYLFPDNPEFAEGMAESIRLRSSIKTPKSLLFGKIEMQGMRIAMELPKEGLFVTPPADKEELVYVKSLTYGATAYFVVVSDRTYDEVMGCFKGLHGSLLDTFKGEGGLLRGSEIYVFITDSTSENAIVATDVDALLDFMTSPFTLQKFGYPLYVDDRSANDDSHLKVL